MDISKVNLNEISGADYIDFLLLKANNLLGFIQYFEDESLLDELAAVVKELETEGIEF